MHTCVLMKEQLEIEKPQFDKCFVFFRFWLNRKQAAVATSSGLSVHHDSLAMHPSSFCSHAKDFGFNANQSVTFDMLVIL